MQDIIDRCLFEPSMYFNMGNISDISGKRGEEQGDEDKLGDEKGRHASPIHSPLEDYMLSHFSLTTWFSQPARFLSTCNKTLRGSHTALLFFSTISF